MFALLADEQAGKQLEGVEYSLQPHTGAATVTTRDERHRQQVLKQVKRNIRTHSIPAKATCWLSALQRSNKNYAYN